MAVNPRYDTRSFNLGRTIAALADPNNRDITAALPESVVEATRQSEHGFSAPRGPGSAVVVPAGQFFRDLNLGTATAGGNLVADPRAPGLDALRGASVVLDAGVSVRELPLGNPPGVPFISGDPTATWAASESGAVGGSEPAIGLADFTPRTVGLHFTMTRKLINGMSPANELLVRRTAARALAKAIDAAVLQGAGSTSEPQGLATLAGVNVTSGTSLSWTAIQAMVAACLSAGVHEDRIRAVGAVGVRQLLGAREAVSTSGRYIWQAGACGGVAAMPSTEAPAGSLFVGDFSNIHLALHGGITLIVDAFTYATSGSVRVVFMMDLDILHPRPSAFARALSIT
jgi:HK97 family phage major capsid protein